MRIIEKLKDQIESIQTLGAKKKNTPQNLETKKVFLLLYITSRKPARCTR